MADQPETPDPEVEDVDELDTPADEAEPVEQGAPDVSADQSSATSPIAQAEYTRATQLAAGIRRELGLPKGATQAEVIEAIRAARVEVDDDDDEDYEEDPALIAEREKRFASELRVTSVMYGEQFTRDGLELLNQIRTNDDLEELFGMLAAFRDSHAPAQAPAPAAAAAAEPDEADTGVEPAIGLSEGDTPPAQRQSTPAGRRESGTTSAVRDIFESLGIASRPREPAKK